MREIYSLMGTAWALMQFFCSPIQVPSLIDSGGGQSCSCPTSVWVRLHSHGVGAEPRLAFAGCVIRYRIIEFQYSSAHRRCHTA